MKKLLSLTSVLLALTAPPASAAPGLDAGWFTAGNNDSFCPVNPASLTDVIDACNDNDAGPNRFAVAIKAPAGISRWVGEEFSIVVSTPAPFLPDWWHLEAADLGAGRPAGCRYGSFGFSTVRGFGSTATCKDYWASTSKPAAPRGFRSPAVRG